jgi:phage portal protein BeeE
MILSKALGWGETVPGVTPLVYRNYSAMNRSNAGKVVNPERARGVATAYRAVNVISDDIAKMPLQLYRQEGEIKVRVLPDGTKRNISYLLEICPNVWGWTPFQLKKNLAQWLLLYGNAYVWKAPVPPNQLLVLGADVTFPVFGGDGTIWYRTMLDGREVYLPGAEVLHTLINPDNSGHYGRGV